MASEVIREWGHMVSVVRVGALTNNGGLRVVPQRGTGTDPCLVYKAADVPEAKSVFTARQHSLLCRALY